MMGRYIPCMMCMVTGGVPQCTMNAPASRAVKLNCTESPGRIMRFQRSGKEVWSYFVGSGHGELGNPSLAAPLPNGLIGINDDFRHRMILIDPASRKIVWQYGHDDHAGTAYGFLNLPDGFDLLLPGGVTPLHIDFPTDAVTPGRP